MSLFRFSILLITASFMLNVGLVERSFSATRHDPSNTSKYWEKKALEAKSKNDLLLEMLVLAVTKKDNRILRILRSRGHHIFKGPQVWNRRTFQKFMLSFLDSLTMKQLKQFCENRNWDGDKELLASYVIAATYYLYAPDKTYLIKLRPQLKRILAWSWHSENATKTLDSIVKSIDAWVGPDLSGELISMAKDIVKIARNHSTWKSCNQMIEHFWNAKKQLMPWEGGKILIKGLKVIGKPDKHGGHEAMDRITKSYFNMHIRDMTPALAADIADHNYYWSEKCRLIEQYFQAHNQHVTWKETPILISILTKYAAKETMGRIINTYFNARIRKMTPTVAVQVSKQHPDSFERIKLIESYYQANKHRREGIEILLNALTKGITSHPNSRHKTVDRITKSYFKLHIREMTSAFAADIAEYNYYQSEKCRLIEQYFQAHNQHLTWKEAPILLNVLTKYATNETIGRIIKTYFKARIPKMTPTVAIQVTKQHPDKLEHDKLIKSYYQASKQRQTWKGVAILLNHCGPETKAWIVKDWFNVSKQK